MNALNTKLLAKLSLTHLHPTCTHILTFFVYAANLAAMKALNMELLAKLSASQGSESGHLVQELKDILASSKVIHHTL